jgi:hypothetical protein
MSTDFFSRSCPISDRYLAEAGPMPYSIAGVMAGFIAFLGGLALVAVAFRW